MVTHSNILAWRIPWKRSLADYSPWGRKESDMTQQLSTAHTGNREEEGQEIIVKEGSEKVGLKLNIQKTKIIASGPITSWEIDGETVSDFIFMGSKITADDYCSHEIGRAHV